MTTRELLIMLMLEGRYVHTADKRGGGMILRVDDKKVYILNDHFRYDVPHNQAWFVPSQPQTTVAVALETVVKLATLVGEE